jgi:hypothetical protein
VALILLKRVGEHSFEELFSNEAFPPEKLS